MWTGPREALMWTGLGLGLLNMNWARLGLTLLIFQGSYVDWAWA